MKLYFKQVSESILNIKPNKRNECFNWGADNAFPSLIEALIGMSVTSKTCSDRVAKAIFGATFGTTGEVIVNSKGQSLNEVLRIGARWYSKQNNCFLQIGYDGNYDIKSIVPVPVTDCRVGKADDKGYSGKYIVYDNWDKSKVNRINTKSFQLYDRYSPDKKVIEGQVEKAGGIEKYNGQILHIKKDDTYVYSLPDLSPVLSEALLESNSQVFRSAGAEEGFLNSKLLVVPPFTDKEERADFKEKVDSLKGAKNAGSVFLLEMSMPTEDVTKQFDISDLTGSYNDKIFEYSDKQAEKNICKAFTVNIILIDPTDSGSLGDSGGKLEEAQNQLWESRDEDRKQFEEAFSGIMKKFQGDKAVKESLVIRNPFLDQEEILEAKNINKKAQADLRGSVGGTNALVDIIAKTASDELPKEQAVAIIKNQYGYSDKKAREMVGIEDDE